MPFRQIPINVDIVADRTFPVLSRKAVMDQKSLAFIHVRVRA